MWNFDVSSELAPPPSEREGQGVGGTGRWKEVWRCKMALPVVHLKFSPDGAMFASASEVGLWLHHLILSHYLLLTLVIKHTLLSDLWHLFTHPSWHVVSSTWIETTNAQCSYHGAKVSKTQGVLARRKIGASTKQLLVGHEWVFFPASLLVKQLAVVFDVNAPLYKVRCFFLHILAVSLHFTVLLNWCLVNSWYSPVRMAIPLPTWPWSMICSC